MQSLPIAVVGGGVTGLAAAHALTRAGKRVRLFEASPRLGGVIQTELDPQGWLIEAGPNSLLLGDPPLVRLLDQLGLTSKLCEASPAAKNRYIVRNGRLQAVPTSPSGFLTTSLFTLGSKLRLIRELARRPRQRTTDLSLAKFMESHLGQDLVDYAVQPFVSGIYAGNAEKLSARHAFPSLWENERQHGSLLRAQQAQAKARRQRGERRPRLVSFQGGLETIPRALASTLLPGCVELNAQVEAVIRDHAWQLVWRHEGEVQTESFSDVIFALPASALAKITVGTLGERPLAALEAVEHPPISAAFLGFQRNQVAHPLDGFGMLVPAKEKRDVLGAIFSSSLFPGRAPLDHVALHVMVGGALQPDLALRPPHEIRARILSDLTPLLGLRGEPVFVRQRTWPRAIPQYNIGYERVKEAIATFEATHPGLRVAGPVRDGISLPACLASGLQVAQQVA
ncbi:MAG TPA: protoporphyrinogen oxidase [Opitutaceae bacterium]|nr:protoporphyrinogen oxidase [Opitutaceae bacterium]